MRALLGIAAVLGMTAVGGLVPLVFRERIEASIGTSMVCDVLATATKLGHLNEEKRKAVIEALVASADTDAKSKLIVERAKAGCAKGKAG